MTYQEKVARAEECFKLILNGSSLSQINDKLKNEGLYLYDITKVMSSVHQMLEDKYGHEIQKDITLSHLYNYMLLYQSYNFWYEWSMQKQKLGYIFVKKPVVAKCKCDHQLNEEKNNEKNIK